MRTNRFAFLLLSLALSGAPAFAAVPYLVEDIDPRFVSEGSQPRGFVAVGGRAVFTAGQDSTLWATAGTPGDPVQIDVGLSRIHSGPTAAGGRVYYTRCGDGGCGLWVTDGTLAGTLRLVRWPSATFLPLEAVVPAGLARTLLLANPGNGATLWATDGTPAGTRKVGLAARNARGLTSFRGKGFFFADLPNAIGALFATDGLPGGTRRIGATTLGTGLTPFGDRLLYLAGAELWSTDGTAAGTRRLVTLPGTGNGFPSPIVIAAGRGFFFRFNANQRELWTTDGTPTGTRRVIAAPDVGEDLAALGGKVAFFASTPERGQELWASDGTAAGTRTVKEICAGSCSGAWRFGISALGRIWFSGGTADRGIETWTSDLTPTGTRQLRDLCPGSCSTDPRGWFAAGNRVYFLGDDGAGAEGRRIYASDGSPAGTRAVGVAAPFAQSLNGVSMGGPKIIFAGNDVSHGVEPWVSDGTPAGTRFLADLFSDNLVGSLPSEFFAAGNRAYFMADDGVHGYELWSSDGTSAGTRLVYEFAPGGDSARLSDLLGQEAGSRLVLFSNRFRFDPFEMIGSDGTPEGTELLLPVGAGADSRRVAAAGRVFFVANDAAHGAELWSTDGTSAGTLRLTDLVPPAPFREEVGGFPALFALGNRAVAPALSPLGGEELWISDGTVGGTRPLDEVYPFLVAPLGQAKSPVVAFGGRFWFVAANPGDGAATLWRTDLTSGGTAPVGPLDLSLTTSGGWSLLPLGGKMLVFGPSSSLGQGLWMSDGTAVGTRVVGSAALGRNVAPVAFAGRLWFTDSDFGTLWSTDGTAVGTVRALDAQGNSLRARVLAALGGRLAIVTENGLYETDGTAAGTLPIDLSGRPGHSTVTGIGAGDRLFFQWDDLLHGPELWALRPE